MRNIPETRSTTGLQSGGGARSLILRHFGWFSLSGVFNAFRDCTSNANVSCNDKTCGIRNFGAKVMDCHGAKAPRNDSVQEMPLVSAFEGCQTTKRSFAFTMAELLIAIAIIGVVAAIVLPSFIAKTQEKELTQARNLMHFKLNEAMNQMQVNEKLTGYNTAEDFVKALGNYLKIMNTCDSDELDKCFPRTFLSASGDEEYDVTTLTKGSNIVASSKKSSFPSNNVGLTLPNGTMIILNYDKDCTWKNPVHAQNSASGDGRNLSTGSVESTACLAMLMDVNGNKKPNKIGKDILNIGVKLGEGLDCVDVGDTGYCATPYDVPFSPIDCTDMSSADNSYCEGSIYSNRNSWAGANKACQELGGRLPTVNEWLKILSYLYDKNITGTDENRTVGPIKYDRVSELAFTLSRYYWTSDGMFCGTQEPCSYKINASESSFWIPASIHDAGNPPDLVKCVE